METNARARAAIVTLLTRTDAGDAARTHRWTQVADPARQRLTLARAIAAYLAQRQIDRDERAGP